MVLDQFSQGMTGDADPLNDAVLLDAVLESQEAPITVFDLGMRIARFNPSAARSALRRWGKAVHPGMPLSELIPEGDYLASLTEMLRAAYAGTTTNRTIWLEGENGGRVLKNLSFHPVRGSDGRVVGAITTAFVLPQPVDRPAPSPYFDLAPLGMAVCRTDGTIIEANEEFAHLVGTPVTQLVGRTVSDFTHPEDRGISPFIALGRGGIKRYDVMKRYVRPDGRVIPVRVAASLLPGDPSLILGIVTEVGTDGQTPRPAEPPRAPGDAIFEAQLNGVALVSPQGVITAANRAFAELLGRGGEKIVGMSVTDFETERSKAEIAECLKEAFAGPMRFRSTFRRPDGSTVPVELAVTSMVQAAQPVLCCAARDLTVEVKAEADAKEERSRFRRLVENIPDILYRFVPEPEPHFDYVSPSVERILGYTPEELTEDPQVLERRIHPDDLAQIERITGLEGAATHSVRARVLHKDGHTVWVDVRRAVVRDEEGRAIAMEGIVRDVSAQVAAEERLRMMATGLEQAAEVAIITDAAGTILEVNSAFEQITGYTRAEAVGKNPRMLQSGRQGRAYYERMWQTLLSGETWRSTLVNRRKNGTEYTADVVINPILDAEGRIVNLIGLQRDATREHVLNAALQQAQKMEAVGQVTGGVAHDFNNLLTVVMASANLIETDLPEDSEGRKHLAELLSAAQHGSAMVRQLLAFGRHEILSPKVVRLADEVGGFLPVVRRVLRDDIELAVAGGDAAWASVDRTALEQIVLNLICNARDAMPRGGRVTVRFDRRQVTESEAADTTVPWRVGEFATVSVQDTGTGIDPATLKRVFEPFFTTKEVGKGSGLGLPMVFGLMQQHEGWVNIESTVGRGTTVTIGFPVAERPPVPTAPAAPVAASGAPGRGEMVLVVEDEDALRRVTARTLEREGFKVLTATDGEAGWAQWMEHGDSIQLILTDAMMPRLRGVDLIRRLRASGTTVPVVLMSGYTDADHHDPVLADVPIVAKPWSGRALAEKIRMALDAALAP